MATKKTKFILNGSVQEKNGKLHLVYSHFDPIKQKNVTKWKAMGLVANENKTIVEQCKREMLRELEEKEERYREGYNDPAYYPLVEFIHNWLASGRTKKLQESTRNGYYKLTDGKITEFFGDKVTLADCKPRLINEFYDWLRSQGDTERTVLHYHNLLHVVFNYAIRQEIFDYNPLIRVDRPKPKKYDAQYYSVDEVKTLINLSEGDSLHIPIIIAAYCGLRRSEVIGLSWSNVDFENGEIKVYQKITEVKKDGKLTQVISNEMKNETSRRVIPMVPMVAEALKKHKEKQEQNRQLFGKAYSNKWTDMVCTNELGDLLKLNYVTSHFTYLLKKLGMRRIRFHDLRHTCASLLLASETNMKVIQLWMGHSSMKTTADIYAHLDMSAKNTAAEALTKLFLLDADDEDEE